MKRFIYLLIVILIFFSCSLFDKDIILQSDTFQLSLNRSGEITEMLDKQGMVNYLADKETAPVLSIRVDNRMLAPKSVKSDQDRLLLTFEGDIKATIQTMSKPSYITLELVSLTESEKVELIVWGPYPTVIHQTIGETIGVVRGEKYALGIQALNPKTLGGYPWQENDCMPQIDIFEQNDLTDMSESGKREVLYRVEAAKPTDFGSSLQTYCRNRNTERVITNWDHEKYTVPAFDDGRVIGSKIALFGCPVEQALETIGKIEIGENLPHPAIDGIWGKQAPSASAAYLIMDFGEKDIDRALEITRQAGLRYLYHPAPFKNWGHFELDEKRFPDGYESMRSCVDKAVEKGIMLGVHTLSNFITTDDPYVTPEPDPRLAKVGSSIITENIDSIQTEIPIALPDFFNQYENNNLKTVMIGKELVRYASVSDASPWVLQDCQRGAFGTKATDHKKNAPVSLLADHAYKVFLGNADLSIEMAENIAKLYNQTGLRQISFDGLEGNRSTGMGNYGEILFTTAWYNQLNDEIKQHYIADASRTSHYFWHIYTRMNWGEPWYAGFRESQTEYRLKNQKYFQRNLMPGMLGWFSMRPETSIEDIEWMLARSAAFNAGYAFVTSAADLAKNANSDKILSLIGEWEKARMAGVFSDEQKKRMQNIENEFSLKSIDDNTWELVQIHSYKYTHEKKVRQPGEPLYSLFSFKNHIDEQPVQFIMTAVDGNVSNIKLEMDHYKTVYLKFALKSGQSLRYMHGGLAAVHDPVGKLLYRVSVDSTAFLVTKGEHELNFDCNFSGGTNPLVKLELRLPGQVEVVGK